MLPLELVKTTSNKESGKVDIVKIPSEPNEFDSALLTSGFKKVTSYYRKETDKFVITAYYTRGQKIQPLN